MRALSESFFFWASLGMLSMSSHATVTMDGTLGRGGALAGPDYIISADLGRQMGGNLFHSFAQFNVGQAESATFSGPTSVSNIIGRVTGGLASSIDGTLRSTIPAANLYLINPAGLIFGPHAVLDVSGSFYASSASYIKLADGSRFDALANPAVSLSVASPAAFGFLGNNSGAIAVNGSQLRVGTGQQLVLVGGALSIDGQGSSILAAPGGKVGLYSVAGEGEIGLSGANGSLPSSYGVVHIQGGANILANGSNGMIQIRAGQLEVADSSLLAQNAGSGGGIQILASESVVLDGAVLQSATNSAAKAGSIVIEAGRLVATNQSGIDTSTFGQGDGGQISVNVGDLTLKDGSRISNFVAEDSTGHGGNTAIHASGTMLVSGQGPSGRLSAVLNNSYGGGDAGSLEIDASRLWLSGGNLQAATTDIGRAGTIRIRAGDLDIDTKGAIYVGTEGRGDGGLVTVDAAHLALSGGGAINGQATGGGRAGEIRIQTGTLDLSDGGSISNRAYYIQRGSGDINVNATEYIHIRGRAEGLSSSPGSDEVSTGIFSFTGNISVTTPELGIFDSGGISTRTWNDLRSGDLNVETNRLTLLNGGHLSAEAIGHSGTYGGAGNITVDASESILVSGVAISRRSGIQSGTRSSGDAGYIEISTPHLRIEDGGMINTSTGVFGEGGAGAIVIQAGKVEVLSTGRILSSSNGYGGKGDISVSADSIMLDHGYISAFGSGGAGAAGRISLHAPSVVMHGGLVNTESDSGTRAGDILIEADTLTLGEGSRIKSDSSDSGNAGNILVRVSGHLKVEDSTFTTGAAHASGGNIDIRAGSLTLANSSAITATVGGGFGDGGNVTVTAQGFAAVEDSDLTARANQGHGGRITINAEVFLRTADVDLDASSNVIGNEGVVEVNAPNLDLTGSLVVLPTNFLDASALLNDPCAALRASEESSFVVKGKGGLPFQPDGLFPGPLMLNTPMRPNDAALPPSAKRPGSNINMSPDCQKWAWEEHLSNVVAVYVPAQIIP